MKTLARLLILTTFCLSSVLSDAATPASEVGKFDFMTRSVLLNNGHRMPIVGLGTYSLSDEQCYNSVTTLLKEGGRLILQKGFLFYAPSDKSLKWKYSKVLINRLYCINFS